MQVESHLFEFDEREYFHRICARLNIITFVVRFPFSGP